MTLLHDGICRLIIPVPVTWSACICVLTGHKQTEGRQTDPRVLHLILTFSRFTDCMAWWLVGPPFHNTPDIKAGFQFITSHHRLPSHIGTKSLNTATICKSRSDSTHQLNPNLSTDTHSWHATSRCLFVTYELFVFLLS